MSVHVSDPYIVSLPAVEKVETTLAEVQSSNRLIVY
jgi:hypothetical protein